jgi:glutamyl-tRNA reductase
VPRDVEPDVKSLPDVFLYTIDELGRIVQEGTESRREAMVEAEAIVTREVAAFAACQAARSAVPAIVELRRRADQYREASSPRHARASPGRGSGGGAGSARQRAREQIPPPSDAGALARPAEERAALERAIEKLYPDA